MNHEDTLIATINRIQTRWGQQALVPLREVCMPVLYSTGFPVLDEQIGGLPAGHLTELSGAVTSGKTTLAYRMLAQAQQGDQIGIIVDPGEMVDPVYAVHCGVMLERLLLIRPKHLAEGLALAGDLADQVGMVVMDVPDALLLNRETLTAMRQMMPVLAKTSCRLLLLTCPGEQEPFLCRSAALQLGVRRAGWQQSRRDVTGLRVEVTICKHRFGAAGGVVMLDVEIDRP